jgi:hypothetical protein
MNCYIIHTHKKYDNNFIRHVILFNWLYISLTRACDSQIVVQHEDSVKYLIGALVLSRKDSSNYIIIYLVLSNNIKILAFYHLQTSRDLF